MFFEQSGNIHHVNSHENAWVRLLELMQDCRIGRLAYCFVVKPWLDFLIAIFLVVLLSPLLLLVALAIRLESGGPAIFRQTRIGKNGRTFVVYKFRTMIADRRKTTLAYEGSDRRKRHKTEHDPRVTRVGKFLRCTSIDELPQLFNVIRGEMSFIGPRPELPQIVMQYANWQHQRHLVKPGLSGWWQVQGRSDLPMHENTGLDIYYVENVSFWLDVQILMRTFRILLSRSGAF